MDKQDTIHELLSYMPADNGYNTADIEAFQLAIQSIQMVEALTAKLKAKEKECEQYERRIQNQRDNLIDLRVAYRALEKELNQIKHGDLL